MSTPETGAPGAPATATAGAPHRRRRIDGNGTASAHATAGAAKTAGSAGARSDAELVAELHRMGGAMSGRKVMFALGVGWPRAKRLVDLAGWSGFTTRAPSGNGNRINGTQPANHDAAESTPAHHVETWTNPMTLQPQLSTDPAGFLPTRSRQLQAIESRTQFQPDSQLTPFTRDSQLCITIRWWDPRPNSEPEDSG